MIQMPQRSVTRFFIPLIDVLLLLFGVFLLMPIAQEERREGEVKNAKNEIEILTRQLNALRAQLELQKDSEGLFKKNQSLQQEIEDLKKNLEQFEKSPLGNKQLFIVEYQAGKGLRQVYPESDKKFHSEESAIRKWIQTNRESFPTLENYYVFEEPQNIGQGFRNKYRQWFKTKDDAGQQIVNNNLP